MLGRLRMTLKEAREAYEQIRSGIDIHPRFPTASQTRKTNREIVAQFFEQIVKKYKNEELLDTFETDVTLCRT
jgi:hypothetical protein